VNLQAGTTGVVIPGVTQAVNFRVEEVDEMPNIGGQDLGSDETAVTVIDNAEYLYLVDDGDSPSADYVSATYSVDELNELGDIEEITVETPGLFLAADKTRVEAANMWATTTPTPFVSFNTANWTQIPFRPKMRAGEVENVGGGGGDKLVNGSFEVVLDSSGNLTADGDIKTGVDGGRFIQDCDDGTTSMRWINVEVESESTQLIRAYSGDPDGEGDSDERAQVRLDWQNEYRSGLTIRSFDRTDSMSTVSHDWNFAGDGDLYIPPGKTIRDSMTGDDLLGGATGDANVWVQTFESATPLLDTPLIALSVEYDSVGNVIALFYNVEDSGGTFYSVGKYTTSGTRIWTTRFATGYNTDGWGLAVDPTNGFIYVAGKTNTDGGQEKSTLTKIASGGGAVEWSKTYAFGVSINSNSQVVDVASDGNPVMVGFAVAGADTGYVTTTKVDAEDGSIIWSKKLDGQADEQAYGMAVGPAGEVVAVGYMDQLGLGSTNAVATVVTVPSSNVNWTTQYGGGDGTNETYQDIIFDIIVTDGVPAITIKTDPVGNRTIGDTIMTLPGDSFGGVNGVDDMVVNVASVSSAAGSEDNHMLVVKYNSAGEIQWQKAILFDEGYDSTGADADIDSEGNVYVCGQYEVDGPGPGAAGICMNLVKFNSAGVKQWSRRVEGDCGSIATSIVVGPDDKLYLSGSLFTTTVPNPGPGDPIDVSCVVAKYNLDGTVVWQRLLDNIDTLSVSGSDFLSSQGGGSNLAVKQDYVALAGGLGTNPGDFRALIAQLPAAGDLFAVGAWDFKASSLTGILDTGASDITVVNAGKTDTDNISNITVATVTPTVDSSDFLIGTLYSAPDSNNSLVNNGNQLILESTGALTLPQGGTITEGYVTSNPTIQLTPASPSVASQKLVIKGGGSYIYTDNGIEINYYVNTAQVGDTLTFYVYSDTYADQTLYWWIYPTDAGIGDSNSGTVALTGTGGEFTILIDSDAYEFTVRVSPESDNYDPANVGVESGLINASAPTFDADHHLHLTTGDLTETSIFLGTDDHNVRTTVDGSIQITTSDTVTNVWEFDTAGALTVPGDLQTVTSLDVITNHIPYYSYQFSSSQVITIADSANLRLGNSTSFTIEAWLYETEYYPTKNAVIVQKGGTKNVDYASYQLILNNETVTFDTGMGSGGGPNIGGKTVNSSTPLPLNQWVHIAVVWNGTTITMYQNGVSVGTTAADPLDMGDNAGAVTIGNIPGGAEPGDNFVGKISNLRIVKNTAVYTGAFTPSTTPLTAIANTSLLTCNAATLTPGTGTITVVNESPFGVYGDKTWTFGTDGKLTAPGNLQVNGGKIILNTGGNAYVESVDYGVNSANSALNIFGGPYQKIKLRAGFGTEATWTLGTNGIMTFPQGTGLYELITGPTNTFGIFANAVVGRSVTVRTSPLSGINKDWVFGADGNLTFPDATVQSTAYIPGSALSTVAKTGVILPTTNGPVETLNHDSVLTGLTNGTYGPFTLDVVTFSVVVSGGVINSTTSLSSSGDVTVDDAIGQMPDTFVGGPGGTTITWTIGSVVQETPTAIDLTKTINKLTDGVYTLANGTEGQIMYLVAQNGVVPTDVSVLVANSRNIGVGTLLPFSVYDNSDDSYYGSIGGFCTLIFTDGAWQQTGGAWGIIT
jgi:hypothetical protein